MSNPSEQNESPQDARQALTDALLREHARLGTADDESLLAAVRSRTVERPAATRIVDLPVMPVARHEAHRRTSAREWMQMAAAVTIAFALVGLFLSRQSVNHTGRSEQTFQLISQQESLPRLTAVAIASASDSATGPGREPVPAEPELGGFTFPNLVGVDSIDSETIFAPSESADPASEELLAEFSVSAERILQVSPDRLVYEGGVILRHPDFTLEADRLELSRLDDEIGSRIDAFVAEGAAVTVEKKSADGVTEVARASTATWDARRGGLVLAGGPPTLNAGASFVRPATSAGVIVLHPDGYQVIER